LTHSEKIEKRRIPENRKSANSDLPTEAVSLDPQRASKTTEKTKV
jgi:hypothetical protein